MNAFDLKTIFLAKHAQHVVLVHFPIALFIAGTFFDFLAQRKRSELFAAAAYYNIFAAAVMAPLVITTGILAWRWGLEGQPLTGLVLEHFIFGLCSGVVIGASWWLHFRARRKSLGRDKRDNLRLVVEFVGVALVAATGHLGGFLSGVNG